MKKENKRKAKITKNPARKKRSQRRLNAKRIASSLPTCVACGKSYAAGRKRLGYTTCLKCGDVTAAKERIAKSKRVSLAYNKGPYMYITSKKVVKDLGKKG